MDYGLWTENSRSTYNKWDGVARCTTQVKILSTFFSGFLQHLVEQILLK